MRRGRVDDNQKQIVSELRGVYGMSVAITSDLGSGFPDIVVGYMGINGMFEIKDPAKPLSARALTKDELHFHAHWHGKVEIAHTADEVIESMMTKARDYGRTNKGTK